MLVTGAASGIGAAVVALCLRAGAVVAGLDLTMAEVDDAAFVPLVADIRDESEVNDAVAGLDGRFADINGLVNCAGVGGYTGDILETTVADWRQVIDVNLTGAFVVSRAVLPRMRHRPGAAIVHVASQYGLVGGAGFPAYCAAKAGIVGLTRAMAVDHAPDGVRVNCVCPGPTDTPMLRGSAAQTAASTRERERVLHRNLLPAPADPARIADTIAFLLGPGSGAMTGAVVPVDGGWTAS